MNDTILEYNSYHLFMNAKISLIQGEELNKEQIKEILYAGFWFGSAIKAAYHKFVTKLNYTTQEFWDALVKVFVFGGVYHGAFKSIVSSKYAKEIVKHKSQLKLVHIGLVGCERKALDNLFQKP